MTDSTVPWCMALLYLRYWCNHTGSVGGGFEYAVIKTKAGDGLGQWQCSACLTTEAAATGAES